MSVAEPLLQMLAATHVVLSVFEPIAKAHSISVGEAHLLSLFPPDDEYPMRRLQIDSGNKATTLGSMIDRLEDRALVERVRSIHDRRAVTVRLTQEGTSVADDIHASVEGFARTLEASGVDLVGLRTITAAIIGQGDNS